MEYDLEHSLSIEDFNMIIDKLVSGKTNPNTDNVLGFENHGILDTYYDWESLLNLTPSDPVNSDGEVSTPSLHGDRQPDQLQGHGSRGSSVSTTDDDVPFSPLSEGAETMMWSAEQQGAVESAALQSHQRESDSGSSSVAVIKARMGMMMSPITTEGHNQSSSSSLPASGIQILEAIPQSSTGESTSQQLQSLANHLPVRQDCSNIFEGNKLNTSHRGAKRKAQVFHGEEEEEYHSPESPGSIKISRNEKNAIAARENRQKKKRELEDLKSTNAAQEKEIVSLHKTSSEQSKEIMLLREELEYYKRVLFNDSDLSALLRSMNPTPTINLDSVFRSRDKNSDNTKTVSGSSGGICLHVCGNSPYASLQFCPTCASKAHTTFDSSPHVNNY